MQEADEKELLLSFDEVLSSQESSPDAGKIITQTLIDYDADCSVVELHSTIALVVTLLKNRKITNREVEMAMTQLVESIDSLACDNPRIFGHIGQMFCDFANVNALSVDWLCDCTSRVADESCKSKVIVGAMKALQKTFGIQAVRSCFGGSDERKALEKLLGPDKFMDIAVEYFLTIT